MLLNQYDLSKKISVETLLRCFFKEHEYIQECQCQLFQSQPQDFREQVKVTSALNAWNAPINYFTLNVTCSQRDYIQNELQLMHERAIKEGKLRYGDFLKQYKSKERKLIHDLHYLINLAVFENTTHGSGQTTNYHSLQPIEKLLSMNKYSESEIAEVLRFTMDCTTNVLERYSTYQSSPARNSLS